MAGNQFPLSVVLSAVDHLTGPLSRVESRIGKFGKKLSKVGRSMSLGITAPVLGFGAAILRSGVQFEEAMIQVQALTGETGDNLDKMADQAKALGRSTIFSATQVAEGQGILALAGLETNEILEATPRILAFGAAANLDFAAAAAIAVEVMKGQGKEAGDLTRITDTLIMGQKSALVGVQALADGFAAGGSVAEIFGIQMEETAAALAILNEKGSKGAEAGTALRQMIVRLTSPATDAQKALAKLGLTSSTFMDDEDQFRGIAHALQALGDAGVKPTELMTIFGQKAGPAFLKLFRTGPEAVREMTAKLKENGITNEIAALRMQGAAGGVRAMKSAFEGLTIAISDSGLLSWFTDAVRKTTEWFQGLSETNPEILKIGTVVALAAAALGPLLIVLGSTVTVVGFMTTAATGLGTALMFLAANPVGILVLSIGALVAGGALLITNWDRIVSGAKAVAFWIGDKVAGAVGWLGVQFKSLIDLIPDWLVDLIPSLGAASWIAGKMAGVGGAGGADAGGVGGDAIGAPIMSREEFFKTTRLELDIQTNGASAVLRPLEGDLDDVELGVTMGAT